VLPLVPSNICRSRAMFYHRDTGLSFEAFSFFSKLVLSSMSKERSMLVVEILDWKSSHAQEL
jgi:hypothetical protein